MEVEASGKMSHSYEDKPLVMITVLLVLDVGLVEKPFSLNPIRFEFLNKETEKKKIRKQRLKMQTVSVNPKESSSLNTSLTSTI